MNSVSFFLSLMITFAAQQPDTLTFQQVPYLYDTDLFTIDSIQVVYFDKGQGEPILFLHGVGSDLSQWDRNYPDLAKKYRVLGIDLPGFGKSDKPRIEYTLDFYCAVIETLLTRQNIKKVTLVGHSFGGHLAVYFSLHRAEKVNNLIIVDGAGIQEFTPGQKQFILTQYDIRKLSNPNPHELRFGLQMGFVKWEDRYEKTVQERIALSKTPEYKDYAFAVNKCVMAMLDKNVKGELPSLKIPTLIVWGAKDALVPPSVAQEAHELIEESELAIIPECGHFPMIEKSGEFNRIIDMFLGGEDE